MPYEVPDMLEDAAAVAAAGFRGHSLGVANKMRRMRDEASAQVLEHAAKIDEANAAGEAAAVRYRDVKHPAVQAAIKAIGERTQGKVLAEAAVAGHQAALDKFNRTVLPSAHRAAAQAALPYVPPGQLFDLERLKRQVAVGAITGGLQYGAQAGAEALYPDLSPTGSAVAAASGAAAGRALVRGYDHYRETSDAASHKTAAYTSYSDLADVWAYLARRRLR